MDAFQMIATVLTIFVSHIAHLVHHASHCRDCRRSEKQVHKNVVVTAHSLASTEHYKYSIKMKTKQGCGYVKHMHL